MIKIICVGKLKEKYLQQAQHEYYQRITKYSKIDIIEIDDVDYKDIDKNLKVEKDQIEKYIGLKDYVITLEIEGNLISSSELALKIDSVFQTNSTITFIIGGSYGLHDDIKQRSNYRLSFSKLTFPHQLFRINLLEQIYRSYKIIKNESYHK